MKIPKEINEALNKRAKYYELALHYGYVIDCFLDENGIEVEDFDRADGCEACINARASSMRVKDAIKEK